MSGVLRYLAATLLSTWLAIEAATLICVPLGLGPNWWTAMCTGFGIVAGLKGERILNAHVAAWKRLWSRGTGPGRDGDGPTLLALFAMHTGPAYLIDRVMVLIPYPDAPSWRHPRRRWRIMTAWAVRTGELMAEADRLADAGLLRCTEQARRRGMWMYEITGLGRDVALRNAEVLMNGRTEERA